MRAHGCVTGLGRPACGFDCQNAMATGFYSRVGTAGSAVVSLILVVFQLVV